MTTLVYDIETYPNIFTCAFIDVETKEKRVYEISDRINHGTQLFEFFSWLRCVNATLVGYNNLHFDYPVIHQFMLNPHYTHVELYAKAMAIISSNDNFAHTIWENDHLIRQLDLFKIHHFDNQAKRTTLKKLQFAMRSESVEDLPFPVEINLDDNQKNMLIEYNIHDIEETLAFYHKSSDQIALRDDLSQKYNKNFTNFNDTKIGKEYFIMELEKNGVQCFTRTPQGKQPNRTFRPSINLGECILPYIRFNQPAFQVVHEWLKNKIITQTKGVFEFIEVTPVMATYMNPDQIKVFKPGNKKPVKYRDWKDDGSPVRIVSGEKDESGLNCVIDGFEYVFGTGGIHGSVPGQTIASDDLSHITADDLAKIKIINLIDCNSNSSEVLSNAKDDLKEFATEYLKFIKGGLQ